MTPLTAIGEAINEHLIQHGYKLANITKMADGATAWNVYQLSGWEYVCEIALGDMVAVRGLVRCYGNNRITLMETVKIDYADPQMLDKVTDRIQTHKLCRRSN